jgi:copper homeostasis protein
MNFEICTDSLEGAIAAGQYGAKRIELCAALSVGGLTPNLGLIQQCVEKADVEVHVMIRHKEGDFNYEAEDLELMKIDIEAAKKVGARGVVFGILDKNLEVSDLNKELIAFAKALNLEVTFHRAFDFVNDFHKAIEKIIEFGTDRLLTSGLQATAEAGLDVIRELQEQYGNQIQIMAGSGVSARNALKIAKSGVNNLHFTARKSVNTAVELSMGERLVVDVEKMKMIMNQFS